MTDSEFLRQHHERLEEAGRRNNKDVTKLFPKGLGNIVKGTIHDCNRKSFEKALKDLDQDLFVVWNPYENNSVGCWQIWIKPKEKTPVYRLTHEGLEYFSLETKLLPVAHHITNLPYLNYEIIGIMRRSQLTEQSISNAEYEHQRRKEKQKQSYRDDRRHEIRQDRKYWKAFQEAVRSGINPMWFFSDKRQGDGQV